MHTNQNVIFFFLLWYGLISFSSFFLLRNTPPPPPTTTTTTTHTHKLQALVYDILPSTTAVFSYAIGSRKLSAKEQFFAGAQTVVSLLQTTQIKQGVSFITANKVYTSTNKTTIVWIKMETLFFMDGQACLGARLLPQSYFRALTASVDSCVEIKSAPSVA